MKLYKCESGIYLNDDESFLSIDQLPWDVLINQDGLYHQLQQMKGSLVTVSPQEFGQQKISAPIGKQEVWASGVTYKRSKEARMEESEKSKGDYFYAKVYAADRPELFFKANPARVSGPGDEVHMRRDSSWNVPEPELTLFVNSKGSIEGYTIGNDMSSRSIEGENPLYLPQAKTYDKCAALGPCILVTESPISEYTMIGLEIMRSGSIVFKDQIPLNAMKRSLTELADYLFRESTFPVGCFLMTGTGIVPESDFTLAVDDVINISIEGIGVLSNTVGQKA